MLQIFRLFLLTLISFILVQEGIAFLSIDFWFLAVCIIFYGEIRVRENLKDIEKLFKKGEVNNH